MAKRGRKKKFKISFNVSPETYRSAFAVLILLISLIILVSFIAPGYYLNEKIQFLLKNSFGLPSFLIPLITAITGLMFIDSFKNKIKELRVIVGLIIMLFALAGMFHIFIPLGEAKDAALIGRGGGYVGYMLAALLINLLSIYGGLPVLAALIVLAVILIFDISIDQFIVFFQEKVKIGSLFSKKSNKDEIVVTPGFNESDDEEDLADSEKITYSENTDRVTKIPLPSFELLPTLSEPLYSAAQVLEEGEIIGPVMPLPTGLPYTDKVWVLPSYNLLEDDHGDPPDTGDIELNKKTIINTLAAFDIHDVKALSPLVGPSFTKYIISLPSGIRGGKIANLQSDLARELSSITGSVRVEAPIPGTSNIGIELPNHNKSTVYFKSLISSEKMRAMKSKLEVVLGIDVGGVSHVYDIAKMPHLLIAGATGSGKSIFIHNIIFSILFRASPLEVKFILVDPKRVELSAYTDMPHLYTPIVTDMEKVPGVFTWVLTEVHRRLKLFQSAKARNFDAYNERSGFQALPNIVVVVDELAEILMADQKSVKRSVEDSIIRIAQLSRATGIHLILAAQRPSSDIITGALKANIPCRVAFNVASHVDSKVIIDQPGAEKLLGKGDMLFVPPDRITPVRLQAAFITENEVTNLTNFLKNQGYPTEYKEAILETPSGSGDNKSIASGGDSTDEKYEEALEIVVSSGKASASLLQRRLAIGYARAARIIDELEKNGVVGAAQGSRPREILQDAMPYEEDHPKDEIRSPQIRLDE